MLNYHFSFNAVVEKEIMKAGAVFELLVEKIYKELSPQAKIIRNDKILGADSKILREIDLSIRSDVSGHEVLILVQAKDYKRKADVNVVGEFITVIKDVRASKGILICNRGFTKGAISLAKNQGVDLCSAHDASIKKWNLELKLPILLRNFNKTISVKFSIKANDALVQKNKNKSVQVSYSLSLKNFTTDDGINMHSIFDLIKRKSGQNFAFASEGGHTVDLMEMNLKVLIEGIFVPVNKLLAIVIQKCSYFIKYVDAEEYRGIKNYDTDKFNPSFISFTTEIKNILPDETWQKIETNKLAITPVVLTIESDSALDQQTYKTGQVGFKVIPALSVRKPPRV